MSTTNNRPFYFSQIRVDPKNPDRIYRMAVDMQFSDDGGYSWRAGMLGQHEDYHAMWIDPNDPEHFIIAGDAGIFQTWDKGGNYDAVNNMAMGQFYGVSFDYQVPYRVCGGLQDNGTSCGWSRRRNGQLLATDWFAVFAADGLQTAQDPYDPSLIYYESQGGNLARRNLATGEVTNIRPRTVTLQTYGQQIATIRGDGTKPLTADQEKQIADIRARMKKEMADPNVANRWNWNTPFILSQHDPNVLYSGADKLFKSVKRGAAPFAISPDLSAHNPDWLRVSGGFDAEANPATDPSGGITRDATGAEENATIVTITESSMRAGMLFVGTDDGKVWMTRNDGGTWEDLSDRYAGVPAMTQVSRVEPSHADSSTIYVSFDNHRRNDFKPYLFVSHDFGKTFRSIASNLPTDRPNSVYVVREDPVNPNLLYAGTELGAYASLNKGASWFPLAENLPTVPVYDLQVHPRDHELIAGTHGRAIQVLDVAPLQQMSADVLAKSAHLFAPTVAFQYAQMLQGSEPRAQRPWKGEGGPSGADIAYRLSAAATGPVRVLIVNAAGDTIARLPGTSKAGINHVAWNFATGAGAVQVAGGRGGGGAPGAGFGAAPAGAGADTGAAAAGGRGGGRGGRGGGGRAGGAGGRGGAAIDTLNVPGFPRGYNPRPSESPAQPDSTASPTNQARLLAEGRGGAGGRGAGGGGQGRGNALEFVETGDFRVVLDIGGQKMTQVLRVVKVEPGQVAVMVGGR
jgi:hypothetical protein